jgi:hypothetical protein
MRTLNFASTRYIRKEQGHMGTCGEGRGGESLEKLLLDKESP